MQKKISIQLFIILFFGISYGIFAQKIELKFTSFNKSNSYILDSLKYKKEHVSKKVAFDEVKKVLQILKNKGFLTASLINSEVKQGVLLATINLGKRINFVNVILNKEQRELLRKNDSILKVPFEKLSQFKQNLSNILIDKGIPFSDVRFNNYVLDKSTLKIDLVINKSKKRIIQKIIYKGYEDFPKNFVKNYFGIDKKLILSQRILDDVQNKIEALDFVESTRKPEILFKKDSTILYIYLKKKTANSIDALVNINTNENNTVEFNGIIDVSLLNILNRGEKFKIYWNRVGRNQSEFIFKSNLPYLFNTKVSSEIDFSIYRQDSTFLNTNLDLKLSYPLNDRFIIGLNFTTLNSNSIKDVNTISNISDFSSISAGVFMEVNSKKRSFNKENFFKQKFGILMRNRKADTDKQNQIELKSTLSSNIDLSERSILFLENKTSLLISRNYLLNELYRIGGINSIRGFDEQSIFANKFSTLNTEYRFYTSKSNYLHTITDISWAENLNRESTFFYSLGFGYLFKRSNNQLNLAYVIGGNSGTNINLNSSRLYLKFITFF